MLYTRSGSVEDERRGSSADLPSELASRDTHGSQTLTVLSHDPVTRMFCSGSHAIALTASSCAPSTRASPVDKFHLGSARLTVRGADALADTTIESSSVQGIPRAPERDAENSGGVLQPPHGHWVGNVVDVGVLASEHEGRKTHRVPARDGETLAVWSPGQRGNAVHGRLESRVTWFQQ